jgi:hypothetical protein
MTPRERTFMGVSLLVAIALSWGVSYLACAPPGTPKREAEDKAFVILEKAACVVIVAEDPNLEPICAKANELAPLVPILMAKRARDAGADSKGD